jgi:hypothetical protein
VAKPPVHNRTGSQKPGNLCIPRGQAQHRRRVGGRGHLLDERERNQRAPQERKRLAGPDDQEGAGDFILGVISGHEHELYRKLT